MLTDDIDWLGCCVALRARTESQGGIWVLCYDSSTDCTEYPSADEGHCSDSSQNTFHGGCDPHTETVVIGHNSLGFTFGGFGQATWSGNLGSFATEAEEDFLFRLGPGAGPVAYRPTGDDTQYQFRSPGFWPTWGYFDLSFGADTALGQSYSDAQGAHTYAGEPNDACGGHSNWGATEMEVWYRVGS